jgi:hypothetical protein
MLELKILPFVIVKRIYFPVPPPPSRIRLISLFQFQQRFLGPGFSIYFPCDTKTNRRKGG